MTVKVSSSISYVSPSLPSTFQSKRTSLKVCMGQGLLNLRQFHVEQLKNTLVVKSCWSIHEKLELKEKLPYSRQVPLAISEDHLENSELEADNSVKEAGHSSVEDVAFLNGVYIYTEGAGGKPGLISFYNRPYKTQDKMLVSRPKKKQNNLLWLAGPAVLVASFIFPSLYLRRILSTIFEDSLLTDFLILFFTEAIFYSGVAVFLLLIDHLGRPCEPLSSSNIRNLNPQVGHKISSVAVLVLSLLIPMVTMGFVWPWTGPAASATLAPYLVGIVVQFAFERYARYIKSPSCAVIPILFQVYRLHQLNRAAQLVTALSYTVKGADMTSHNLAISSSLSTLLNVLQFLGVITIWSLSSFIMRLLPSATITEE